MEVKIAVPLGAENKVFHDDPWSAPLFAIYSVTENDDKLIYNCIAQKENPWVLRMKILSLIQAFVQRDPAISSKTAPITSWTITSF